MLDRRASVIAAVPPAGLALGLALWLVFGRAGTANAVEAVQARLNALPLASTIASASGSRVTAAISKPLFALTAGPGAMAEVSIKLQGIARSPGRAAALLSVSGQPPAWVEQGQSVSGVILDEVSGTKVVVDTPLGLREVKLGEAVGPQTSSTAAGNLGPQEIPPGYRSPPPPASAPAMGG